MRAHDSVAALAARFARQRGDADGDCVGAGIGEAERIAVWIGAGDLLGAEAAAGADAVFHDELLAQAHRELLRDQAGDGVGAAARRERHDEADRPLRPARIAGLRLRRARAKQRSQYRRGKAGHGGYPASLVQNVCGRLLRSRNLLGLAQAFKQG
jgi:hypothetical protein